MLTIKTIIYDFLLLYACDAPNGRCCCCMAWRLVNWPSLASPAPLIPNITTKLLQARESDARRHKRTFLRKKKPAPNRFSVSSGSRIEVFFISLASIPYVNTKSKQSQKPKVELRGGWWPHAAISRSIEWQWYPPSPHSAHPFPSTAGGTPLLACNNATDHTQAIEWVRA